MRLNPFRRDTESRSDPALSLQTYVDWLTSFSFNGVNFTLPGSEQEEIRDYTSLVRGAYKSCPVVFACMDVRAKLFSEARFQWRNVKNGSMFGTPELAALEVPWPGGSTVDLLQRMIQTVDLAGNAFVVRQPPGVGLLRPDWVDILTGSRREDSDAWDVDAQIVGYLYHRGGRRSGRDPEVFMPNEVAHFYTVPDPEARFRGMSWITPVIREVMSDKAATQHKQMFFQNGATPNMVVKFDLDNVEKMRPWIDLFKEQHEGAMNAYKTLFIGGGTDATPVGLDFQQLEFKITQGAGETRIAAAAGTPPVIVGLSEGLQAATYSNYSQARRRFADGTMRPIWRNACSCLQNIVSVPPGAELWYDDRDIPALKEDIQDKAKEMQEKATAANQLVSAGYTRDSIVAALEAGDFSLLKPDPNPPSVQLQLNPPTKDSVSTPGQAPALPTANGSTP
jgi:phage portal protein BeeE